MIHPGSRHPLGGSWVCVSDHCTCSPSVWLPAPLPHRVGDTQSGSGGLRSTKPSRLSGEVASRLPHHTTCPGQTWLLDSPLFLSRSSQTRSQDTGRFRGQHTQIPAIPLSPGLTLLSAPLWSFGPPGLPHPPSHLCPPPSAPLPGGALALAASSFGF